jgi:pimeloyl-ACP methyl ester carboxylesterase
MSDNAPIPPALGICLEEYEYPYPVRFLPLSSDLQPVSMAYMDIPPGREPNGKTVVLMHGKAFGCYYFRNVIEALTGAGYRVVAPDQIGWGKSPKPDIHYSFQLLAANTAALLDHLGITDVAVLGHSTGGMTAVRFALTYPGRVTHLVLEDPLGLADYRTGISPQSEETLYDHELRWTDPAVIRGYVKGYFVHPDPKIWEPLAGVLVRVTLGPDYPRWARAAALTFQMICRAGESTIPTTPPATLTATIAPTEAFPATASAHSRPATRPEIVWVPISSLRRLTRSATVPPHGPNSSDGTPPAASTRPSSVAEPVSRRTSQPIAVCCTNVPLAEAT